jgi:hypothetical protein
VFTERIDRRAFRLFAQLALSVGVLAAPASAAVVADFNGDGRADRVTSSSSSHAFVFVTVSGQDTQVLRVSDRILAVVAVDIDHDGTLDLSTLSPRRGLSVWLNRGGKFVRARRTHHPQGVTIERPGPRARPGDEGHSVPSAPTGADSDQLAQVVERSVLVPPCLAGAIATNINPDTAAVHGRTGHSRAPPPLAPT